MTRNALKLSPQDNVASAIVPLKTGETAEIYYHDELLEQIPLVDDVPFGFKFAARDISKGEDILKYGVPMGVASADIRAGEMVHVHNVEGARGRGDKGEAK
ncbi:MAG: UxaA family hydrolase [Methylobacteriaceae bacterium]|nr:UxaA family hydrolase [Methylobacteriaceae bacterium]